MVSGKDGIGASSHNNTVFLLSQAADQVAHVKEYSVLSGQTMVPVKFPEPGL